MVMVYFHSHITSKASSFFKEPIDNRTEIPCGSIAHFQWI